MRYAVVVERAQTNYAAYVPDLPGCVATRSRTRPGNGSTIGSRAKPDIPA